MYLRTGIVTMLAMMFSATLALAGRGGQGGAGGGQGDGGTPKAGRLGVPTNVMCSKAGDQLLLTWDAVTGAMQYRVYLEAEDGGELVDTVPAPQTAYAHPMSDMSEDPADEVKGHVRALASKMGRDASKPSRPVTCQ